MMSDDIDFVTRKPCRYLVEAGHVCNKCGQIHYSAEQAHERIENLTRQLAEVTKERDALRADAERYRWLRDKHDDGDEQWYVYGAHTNNLDAEIDAAKETK